MSALTTEETALLSSIAECDQPVPEDNQHALRLITLGYAEWFRGKLASTAIGRAHLAMLDMGPDVAAGYSPKPRFAMHKTISAFRKAGLIPQETADASHKAVEKYWKSFP